MVRFSCLSVLGILFFANSGVHAGTLTNATWLQVTQDVPMTRTFGQLGAAGTSTASSVAVTLSYPFFSTNFFVPKTLNQALDFAVHITQGGAQAITATPGMARGTPGVPGTVVVMTAAHVAKGINQSAFVVGVHTLVKVPLNAGKAGQFMGTFSVVGALHTITVDFYAWTPGTVAFYVLSSLGDSLPPVTAMGSFDLTANGGGTVALVSPSKVSIDGPLAQRRTASFTKLAMTFVPEPGWLLLLGGGAAGLALAGAGRRARR